ncbi:hypothetical protein [Clostridium sp. Marseille-P299]|uniref:hypothetical protein n=1 Tax=Clostridium sp. Marseille-P299 TaxID=1805477 RepID=UPI000A424B75|nr:hypothetical protein [Clostridium sp. Marseille-P299]
MMGIQGVTSGRVVYEKTTAGPTSKQKNATATSTNQAENKSAYSEEAATCEISSNKEQITGKADKATIERLKADAEARNAQLRSLVEKMFLKQGDTLLASDNIYELLRTGKVKVDDETAAKAKQEISENGYYGVEQTSERLVSFAKALAGNDPEKADELMNAVKKGFEQATKAWGGELPEICKKTLDTTLEKLTKWKEELNKN